MAKRRMTYELDAEEAKALDAFRTLTAEQRRSLAESEKGVQASHKQGKAIRWLEGQWKALVATGLGMVGVNELLDKAVELLKDYEEYLDKIAKKQSQTASGGLSLAMAQKTPEDVSRVMQQAAIMSAEQGMIPEKGFAFFEQGQAIFGSFEKGAEAAVEAMKLAKITGDPDTAVGTIKIADQLKLSQAAFNSLLIGAALPSGATEKTFAEVSPYWPMFTGKEGEPEPYVGAAITTALSQRISNEHLATYVQAVNRTLTDVGVESLKEIKKKGDNLTVQEQITKQLLGTTGQTFRDLTSLERIEAIGAYTEKKYGKVTNETLRLVGIEEQRERTAMATLLTPDNLAMMKHVLTEGPTYAQAYNLDERIATLSQEPNIRKLFLEQENKAMAEAYAYMGPSGELASAKAAGRAAAGAQSGYGFGTDPETGEAGWWMRKVASPEYTMSRVGQFGPYYEATSPDSAKAMDRLDEALEENAKLLREIADNTTPKQREQVNMRTEGGF